jgi:hypothetical protein
VENGRVEGLGGGPPIDAVVPLPRLRCRTQHTLAFRLFLLRSYEQNRHGCIDFVIENKGQRGDICRPEVSSSVSPRHSLQEGYSQTYSLGPVPPARFLVHQRNGVSGLHRLLSLHISSTTLAPTWVSSVLDSPHLIQLRNRLIQLQAYWVHVLYVQTPVQTLTCFP